MFIKKIFWVKSPYGGKYMKKFLSLFIIILCFTCVNIFSKSFGKEENSSNNSQSTITGKVLTKKLNIRSGLSTNNECIGTLSQNDTIHIYDKINNWYIIKTENNLVGAVFADYIETSFETDETIETSANIETAGTISNIQLSQDEQIFFNLINNKRIENNLTEFEIDENLLNIARLKAQDIVENQYFSHNSPTYGSIFEMLNSNNITYTKASENIAKSSDANKAIETLMKSNSHKENILNNDFNYTGIAVQNSPLYGKIFVEIFISK